MSGNKMALDALTAALDAMEHMANTLDNMDDYARMGGIVPSGAFQILRQYIEQGAGAAPGADVVMVPRKTAISARDHVPYLGETWRALNAAISAAPQPQQEQSNG